jgi:phage terminase large subunit
VARIKLPNNWKPRPDQLPLWSYMENGGKRAIVIGHRRWGKDDVALHATSCAMAQRVGNYWHMLPEYGQARKAIWEAVNPFTGKRRIDEAFPEALRSNTRTQDMLIKYKNGSTWQLVGSDNFNSLVGAPPIGLVFSEYAIANPSAWSYLRPILAQNDGWVIFITTPRGKNHACSLYNMAKTDPTWFSALITAEDSHVFTKQQLQDERRELISQMGAEEGEAFFRQEYYCSFEGAICGSYYGGVLELATQEGRIGKVPHDPSLQVYTSWDLGIGDATGIWFFQTHNQEVRVIDYYEASGEGLGYYAKLLDKKPYKYANHIMPHDIRVRELGTGQSRYETSEKLGIRPITIARSLPIDDGIDAVRSLISRCYFDEKKCGQGLEALRSYRKEYDDKRKEYKNRPYHDWTSHAADAFRMFAVGHTETKKQQPVSSFLQKFNFAGAW